MTDLFLLGAGASVEAKIPSTFDMTKKMLDAFSHDMWLERHNKILRFTVGVLMFKRGAGGENPYDGVNIEDLFNAVSLLADRKNSELSPFVSAWNPAINEMEGGEVSDFTAGQLLDKIYEPVERHLSDRENNQGVWGIGQDRIDHFFSQSDFGSWLTSAMSEFSIGSGGLLFSETADKMTRKLIEMVWVTDTNRIQYLLPLINYVQHNGATIATLNYDNTIELSSELAGVQIDTGFESWSESGDFSFKKDHIPLIKLHGSIDWALSEASPSVEKPLQYEIIKKVVPTDNSNKEFSPSILFGGKNKLTAKGPFLSLLRAFEIQINDCNRLIVIGYSFRDEHVNEYIRTWMNSNPARVITIIDPKIAQLDSSFVNELNDIQSRDRVVKIAKNASEGILDIIAQQP